MNFSSIFDMGKRGRGKRPQKKFKKRGLILCEGKTEENYFKGFVSQERYKRNFTSISVDIYKPKDHSPHGLLEEAKSRYKEAKKEKNPFDFIWIVFDKDGHIKVPNTFEEAINSPMPVKIAFTVPCFEYFALLHFERTTKPYKRCKGVISAITGNHIPDYEKSSNLFETLKLKHTTGLKNSKWVLSQLEEDLARGKKPYDLSCYSNIHEIIENLHKTYVDS